MKEAGYDHWNSPNTGATNSSGWTGLPGGYRYSGGFYDNGSFGYWWSASESGSYSWNRVLNDYNDYVYRFNYDQFSGFSARCVRCEADEDGDGVCDNTDECIDNTACNFEAVPSEPCEYTSCAGCTDSSFCNYDFTATIDDGSCEGDSDGDGICDSQDNCDGVEDECGVCNGPGPTELVIDTITLLYDSIYSEAISEWWVFETGADTTYTYVCYIDECGVVDGDNSCLDDCGVPYGDNSTCLFDFNIHEAVDLWLSDQAQAEATYGHISEWDVSNVTDMSWMFHDNWNEINFNGDISSWDVSSVTIMEGMFAGIHFNGDLSSWDVSSVTDMSDMFHAGPNWSIFNGNLSSWDVSSVTDMSRMFSYAYSFNGDISSWDVSSVTSMESMFNTADSFNGDLSEWNVSSVTNMSRMFSTYNGASSFNQDLSSWDVSSVTNMDGMFEDTSALSEENQCLIHTSFSSNAHWPYDWSEFCPAPCGELVSHDGYDYSTVQIGDQCWFAENCRYLPSVSLSSASSTTDPYYYVYGYEGTDVAAAQATDNYATYGVLYNWPAVMTAGVCPSGWHIPSDEEFTQLTDFLGGESVAGGKMKEAGYDHWNSPNTGATNSSGWTGLPGGLRFSGDFYDFGNDGFWWSASGSGSYSWVRGLNHSNDNVYRYNFSLQDDGVSVRCVRD